MIFGSFCRKGCWNWGERGKAAPPPGKSVQGELCGTWGRLTDKRASGTDYVPGPRARPPAGEGKQ